MREGERERESWGGGGGGGGAGSGECGAVGSGRLLISNLRLSLELPKQNFDFVGGDAVAQHHG